MIIKNATLSSFRGVGGGAWGVRLARNSSRVLLFRALTSSSVMDESYSTAHNFDDFHDFHYFHDYPHQCAFAPGNVRLKNT